MAKITLSASVAGSKIELLDKGSSGKTLESAVPGICFFAINLFAE